MTKIIILHGWGNASDIWLPLVQNLGRDYVVEAWDFPGFGKEPLISTEWGVPEYAAWVLEKIGDAESASIVLLGHSFGGRISAYIATQNPKWLKGLILSGAPVIRRPSINVKLRIAVYKMLKRVLPQIILRRIFFTQELSDADRDGKGKIFRNVVNFDQTEILPHIAVPTLLLWGDQDEEVPVRIAREVNQLIPGSRLEVLSASHQVYLDKPELFYGKVKSFLQGIE